jgi:primosomal protein N' (replication factor Y)
MKGFQAMTNDDYIAQKLFSPAADRWYADVIVPAYLPKTLTWYIPDEWVPQLKAGIRVEVQVGKTKRYAGIVSQIHQVYPGNYEIKPILSIIDEQPVIYQQQLDLWKWMAGYYCCSEGEVMMAALPSHLKLSSETVVQFNDMHGHLPEQLSDKEYLLAEALEIKQSLSIGEIQTLLDSHHVYPTVKKLVEKGIAMVFEEMSEKFKQKTETYILLHPQYHNEQALEKLVNEWARAPRQLDLLLVFLHFERTEGIVTRAALLKKANSSPAILDGLIQKEVLISEKRAVDRLETYAKNIEIKHQLSEAQVAALAAVRNAFTAHPVCLLHGVTGSGKTQLYIELIAEEIRKGKQCLYLLPEIALTAQIIRKLQLHFGGYAGIYHSKFNANERVELWNKVRNGEIQLVLGARSALFLPFRELSLIVVDEEHDHSFKQYEPAPRYHARDAAIYYAHLCQAKVLLGSATPSVESYFNAQAGKYGLVTLAERYGELQLPAMQVIDLKAIPGKRKERILISEPLQQAMQQTLDGGKQVIVFQNRRGYSPYQMCSTCGWIPKCEQCDVSLTFHKSTNKLHCHYCGNSYPQAKTCAQCGHNEFRQQSFGTERLEELLDEQFPKAVVARMDTDSVRGKNAHETLIRQFEEQRVQILVGTQMVVKGLDFDHVGLVCIPDGDGIFGFADFRVHERAFQLIEQVSGRAGRKGEQGKMLLQLYQTKNNLLPFLLNHDYRGFFVQEIESRKQFFYPPFSKLILVQCRHRYQSTALQASEMLAEWLRQRYDKYLTGPGEPPVNRIRNLYLCECLLKLPRSQQVLAEAKVYLRQGIIEMQHLPAFRAVSVMIDVDPQ